MRHHPHPGPAGRFSDPESTFEPHPDAVRSDALSVWVALPDAAGRDIESLEALRAVPTRPGAVRLAAIPHLAVGLTLGDELAIGDWDGEPMARGLLASALRGTVRVVLLDTAAWEALAHEVDAACDDLCWFDVIGEHAVAVSVPRAALGSVFALLNDRAGHGALTWEYATPERHVPAPV